MAVTTFGRAANVTRHAATAATNATSLKYMWGALLAIWALVAANRAEVLGNPMPLEWLVIALSALITASVTLALWAWFRKALMYSVFLAGRAVEKEAQRRRAQKPPGQ